MRNHRLGILGAVPVATPEELARRAAAEAQATNVSTGPRFDATALKGWATIAGMGAVIGAVPGALMGGKKGAIIGASVVGLGAIGLAVYVVSTY
jgi:hypothetical protein